MADQLRWFKVWTSIISDDDFDPVRAGNLNGLGRMCMLGAYTALHGRKGIVKIMQDTLLRLLQAHNLDELRHDIALKNVSFEEGKNHHGKITVTWDKWIKYQLDSTQAQRQQTSRSKRREEERREEEIRQDKINPLTPLSGFDSFWEAYPKKKSKGQAEKAWKALNSSPDLETKILEAIKQAVRCEEWRKDAGQFIPYPATWLRAKGWEDERGNGQMRPQPPVFVSRLPTERRADPEMQTKLKTLVSDLTAKITAKNG